MGDLPDGFSEEELERLDSLVFAWAEDGTSRLVELGTLELRRPSFNKEG